MRAATLVTESIQRSLREAFPTLPIKFYLEYGVFDNRLDARVVLQIARSKSIVYGYKGDLVNGSNSIVEERLVDIIIRDITLGRETLFDKVKRMVDPNGMFDMAKPHNSTIGMQFYQ